MLWPRTYEKETVNYFYQKCNDRKEKLKEFFKTNTDTPVILLGQKFNNRHDPVNKDSELRFFYQPINETVKNNASSQKDPQAFVYLNVSDKKNSVLKFVLDEWGELVVPDALLKLFWGEIDCKKQKIISKLEELSEIATNDKDDAVKKEKKFRWKIIKDADSFRISATFQSGCQPRVGLHHLHTLLSDDKKQKLHIQLLIRPRKKTSIDSNQPNTLVNTAPLNKTEWIDLNTGKTFSGLEAWPEREFQTKHYESLYKMFLLAYSPKIHGLQNNSIVALNDDAELSLLSLIPLINALEGVVKEQKRQYIRKKTTARSPSGTIRFGAYFTNVMSGRPDIVPLDKFVFTYNTPLNQIFKAVNQLAIRRINTIKQRSQFAKIIRSRLQHIQQHFFQTSLVPLHRGLFQQIKISQYSELHQHAFTLSKMIFEQRYPDINLLSSPTTGEQSSFEIDMAGLFEDACRQFLGHCLKRLSQHFKAIDGNENNFGTSHSVAWNLDDEEKKDGKKPKLKPDLVVKEGKDTTRMIGDVKYKLLESFSKESSFYPLDRSDFHQMMSYMYAFEQKEGLLLFLSQNTEEAGTISQKIQHLSLPKNGRFQLFSINIQALKLHNGKLSNRLEDEPLYKWLEKTLKTDTGS